MSARHRPRGPRSLGLGLLLAAAQAVTIAGSPVSAADPTPAPSTSGTPETPPSRLFGPSTGASPAKPAAPAPAAPVPTAGFADTVVMSGLTRPIAIRFASDGSVFVAEKSGLIKMFSSLTDTSPVVVADLQSEVQDYWDRGLMGFASIRTTRHRPLSPTSCTRTTPGSAARRRPMDDGCPSPPGANTDGCFVSGRLSRLTISGVSSTEQVLINDWCQQFPSHSVGDLRFGADGALYATGGEGASFIDVDFGQFGGTLLLRRPRPIRAGIRPPGQVRAEQPPAAEGGALRAQSRTPGGRRACRARWHGHPGRPGDRCCPLGQSAHPQPGREHARIVGYGLRNPFRFATRPGTNDLWIGNVGW